MEEEKHLEQMRGAVKLWVHCEERLGPVSLDEMTWVDPVEWLSRLFDVSEQAVQKALEAERIRVAPAVEAKREKEEREAEAWRRKREEERQQREAEREELRRERAKTDPLYETIEESRARWAREKK